MKKTALFLLTFTQIFILALGCTSSAISAPKQNLIHQDKKIVPIYKLTTAEIQFLGQNLNAEERRVILNKGTEAPGTGQYLNHSEAGTYTCKQCGQELYKSSDKFDSHCGWPAFDDEIAGAITHKVDSDGHRTEILCSKCSAHLGHIFEGEHMTDKNIRHCVNSISLSFKSNKEQEKSKSHTKKAYFAGGCFWGVEYFMEKLPGVLKVESGYMGGQQENPTYQDISYKNTGHVEAVEILYNPQKISYETLAKQFFEIHDPTQTNGQGPDIGTQYLSRIFTQNEEEAKTIHKLVQILENKGLQIATQVKPYKKFYSAEDYHQNYYQKHKKEPYCHGYVKRF